MLITLVKTLLIHFTYLALVVVLALAGLGMPVPEDIPLIFSGYLCSHQYSPIRDIEIDTNGDGIPDKTIHHTAPHRLPMIIAGMVGVLLGDSIVFSIGRRGIDADNFVARHLRKVMHSKRREKVERHFARHGNWTVFAGRFFPGFRSVVFAFAGMSKMSYLRFVIIDGLAALISVPAFVLLGWYFAGQINELFIRLERVKHIVIPVGLVLVIGGIVLYIIRRRRALPVA